MAPESIAVVSQSQELVKSRLDIPQVLKASGALVSHIKSQAKKKEATSEKKNLLADADDDAETEAIDAEPVWLIVSTKKHITDQRRLKPGKIRVPHTLNKSATSICVITTDPQRSFKDVVEHPSFPSALRSQIRIFGVEKLKARNKTFQEMRRLRDEYDVFMADDRVVPMLPKILGKVFYDSQKRPLPVNLAGTRPEKDGKRVNSKSNAENRRVATPAQLAKEIENTLSCARIHLSPSSTTAVKVGFSNFSAQQLSENIQAVVDGMIEKFISRKWKNVKAIHIKGPTTIAFPIYATDELWVDSEDVIEDKQAEKAKEIGSQKNTKRKGRENEEERNSKKQKSILSQEVKKEKSKAQQGADAELNESMQQRRKALREAKQQARDAAVSS